MNKTININLAGRAFIIDQDAYELLDKYLNNLKSYFQSEDGASEIIADFESRISELLADKVTSPESMVVSVDVVKQVIAQLGDVKDIADEDADKPKNDADSTTAADVNVQKRLYRDLHNKVLGGVLAGVAAYFGWDKTWVRLAYVLLVVLPFPIGLFGAIIIYLIMWMLVPGAHTVVEQMAMRGEKTTVNNIGKKIIYDESAQDEPSQLVKFLGKALSVCIKIAGLILLLPISFFVLIAVLVIIVSLVAMFGCAGSLIYDNVIPTFAYIIPIGLMFVSYMIFVLGMPFLAILYFILSRIFKIRQVSNVTKIIFFIVWLVFLILGVLFIKRTKDCNDDSYPLSEMNVVNIETDAPKNGSTITTKIVTVGNPLSPDTIMVQSDTIYYGDI